MIRWLLSLLLTAGFGVAPSVGELMGPEDDVIYDVAAERPPPEGGAYVNGAEIVDANGSFEAVESANDANPE